MDITDYNARLHRQLVYWLLSGCFLVFAMVIVGGITRLTGSGLSITEWKVITGAIPPLTESQWMAEFDKYKLIPQYRELNSNFTLSDFKFIYFWEFTHRLIGRSIGLVFLGGLFYFMQKKAISPALKPRLWFMFLLGGIQGFLGWYMVSSGLTQNVRVSHIRLAIHLTFAFITFGYIFKVALHELFPSEDKNAPALQRMRTALNVLLVLVTVQIIYGAFVAGTKAGWVYNTWPKMGDEWVAESVGYAWQTDGASSIINNLASVQFIHRMLAYVVAGFILLISYFAGKNTLLNQEQRKAISMLVTIVVLQVALGIFTLLSSVPLWLGVTHQAVAFLLFAGVIYAGHQVRWGVEMK